MVHPVRPSSGCDVREDGEREDRASDAARRLRAVGLRPTRQRVALTGLIYDGGDRHFSVEDLHAEAMACEIDVSLATVYNTLNHFTEAGLLRVLSVEGSRTYFDTNTSNHQHFFIEEENRVVDIEDTLMLASMPSIPEGMEVAQVDVVVRLRRKRG